MLPAVENPLLDCSPSHSEESWILTNCALPCTCRECRGTRSDVSIGCNTDDNLLNVADASAGVSWAYDELGPDRDGTEVADGVSHRVRYASDMASRLTWAASPDSAEARPRDAVYACDMLSRRLDVEGFSSTRTASTVSGMDTIFEKDRSGAVTKYVYADGLQVARIDCTAANPPTCTTSYYSGNHLGSTRKILDASRTTIFSTSYERFGKPFSTFWSEAYKFTGEKHDDPTGSVYLRARQHDPEIEWFASGIRSPAFEWAGPSPINTPRLIYIP